MAENLQIKCVTMLFLMVFNVDGRIINKYIVNSQTKSAIRLKIDSTTNQVIDCQISHNKPKQLINDDLRWKEAEILCDSLKKTENSLKDLIYPGTKWCGVGNRAKSLDDLGENLLADLCCRSHDLCVDSVQPGQTKHSIQNNSPFTISSCECDVEFERCLSSNEKDEASFVIKYLYFNVANIKCFKKQHPIIRCLRFNKKDHHGCLKYELDYSKPKTYQLFDLAHMFVTKK
ncbi:hypothetical protein CHUAL_005976 [Chamberlinius hualienensis]